MTLQEVLNRIPEATRSKRVPSVVALAEKAVPVLADALEEATCATIYSNGYVVFQKDEHATVFRLHDCREYEYRTAEEINIIPFSEFADQPWQVRVFMEGKDRLVHNQNNRKEGRTVSIDAYEADDTWLEISDMGAGDPLNILIDRESCQEEVKLLRKYLSKLPDFQREILQLCVVRGLTHEEAAKVMHTSRQAVTTSLKRALHNLRKMYGISDNGRGRNSFARKRE